MITVEHLTEIWDALQTGTIRKSDMVRCGRCRNWIGPTHKLAPHWIICDHGKGT